MSDHYTKESKKEWYTEGVANTEQLKLGCLQRIATATEVMSRNYQQLINERDSYKQRLEWEQNRRQTLERSVAALRGVITKLKKAHTTAEPAS